VDLGLFQACVKGFSFGRGTFAQSAQITAQQMSIAPAYIAFTLGVRFVIDHLRGDEYFRVPSAATISAVRLSNLPCCSNLMGCGCSCMNARWRIYPSI